MNYLFTEQNDFNCKSGIETLHVITENLMLIVNWETDFFKSKNFFHILVNDYCRRLAQTF